MTVEKELSQGEVEVASEAQKNERVKHHNFQLKFSLARLMAENNQMNISVLRKLYDFIKVETFEQAEDIEWQQKMEAAKLVLFAGVKEENIEKQVKALYEFVKEEVAE